ncbi:hypothetical protein [Glycomyces sp. NPDC021274]|uniref:hypothetical protein n=1 Tax=Glycomyces sp. NPDC021274 TaxID=3155120 RepID=UPI0033DD0785
MGIDWTAVFNALVVAALAALVVAVVATYGRRARIIATQAHEVPRWADEHGFALLDNVEAVRATGRRQGLTGSSAKLFAGIAATPFEENVKLLLHRPATGHWVVQHGIRNGNPRRAQPRTALGMALDYHWADAVAVGLPGNAGPLLITRRNRMRASLWIHRRLRLATGDRAFDREFGVVGADAGYAEMVLSKSVRSWLLEAEFPAKTVLVLDGGWCYAARHEPLRLATVPDRIALVTGFVERLPREAWKAADR